MSKKMKSNSQGFVYSNNNFSNAKPTKTYSKYKNDIVINPSTNNKAIEKQGLLVDIQEVFIKYYRDTNDSHPNVIGGSVDNKYISVGLTTEKFKGKSNNTGTNKQIDINPLDDNVKGYLRRSCTIDDKNKFTGNYIGILSNDDANWVKGMSNKAKEKYKNKK